MCCSCGWPAATRRPTWPRHEGRRARRRAGPSSTAGPNGVSPGDTSLATTVSLRAGHYAVLCMIPGPDGVPHVAKGMITRPRREAGGVSGGGGDAGERRHHLAVRLRLQVERADHARHARGARAQRRRAAARDRARAPAAREDDGRPRRVGEEDGLATARRVHRRREPHRARAASNDLALSLQPGHYAMLCFLPDAKDHAPHIAHGMVHEFTVR